MNKSNMSEHNDDIIYKIKDEDNEDMAVRVILEYNTCITAYIFDSKHRIFMLRIMPNNLASMDFNIHNLQCYKSTSPCIRIYYSIHGIIYNTCNTCMLQGYEYDKALSKLGPGEHFPELPSNTPILK